MVMAKILTMYNNKGGVSKTTTLFNLGAFLAIRKQKKVLLVDCDPQCNLTELFFASIDGIDEPDFKLPGTSIYQALQPRFKGETSRINVKDVEVVKSALYDNFFLLRGDLEFSFAETYLGTAWSQAITDDYHQKNNYVSIHLLIQDLLSYGMYDYILCDVGPSAGAITRSVVLACDGFFMPMIPDRFCNQAISLLGELLTNWIERNKIITKSFDIFNVPLIPGDPQFLGAVIQNFKIYSGSNPKKSYEKWKNLISNNISETLISNKNIRHGKLISKENVYIASIRDVGTMAPTAQFFGRPIFDIKQEHTREASTNMQKYSGSVWENWIDRMNEYEEEINKMAMVIQ